MNPSGSNKLYFRSYKAELQEFVNVEDVEEQIVTWFDKTTLGKVRGKTAFEVDRRESIFSTSQMNVSASSVFTGHIVYCICIHRCL